MKIRKKLVDLLFAGLIGVGIGFIISIIVSIIEGSGQYYPVVPSFQAKYLSQINAVIVATLLYAFLGIISSALSSIYELKSISLLSRSIIHFISMYIVMVVVGNFLHWYMMNFVSFLLFGIIFILIYLIIWTIKYYQYKKDIKQINNEISKNH